MIEVGIEAIMREQLLVCTLFRNRSILQNYDVVRILTESEASK